MHQTVTYRVSGYMYLDHLSACLAANFFTPQMIKTQDTRHRRGKKSAGSLIGPGRLTTHATRSTQPYSPTLVCLTVRAPLQGSRFFRVRASPRESESLHKRYPDSHTNATAIQLFLSFNEVLSGYNQRAPSKQDTRPYVFIIPVM